MYDTHFFIVTKLMLNQYLKTTMYDIVIVKKKLLENMIYQ